LEALPDPSGVVVRVSDNGIGIPVSMLERIFEMFTQVDSPADADYGGLGIGLTLVRSLVEMHGGRIKAESAGPGQGSSFSFQLPVLAAPDPGSLSGSPQSATTGAARRKVLVVDDNKAAADTLAMAVEMMGHEVRVASNGQEGVELASRFLPAVVLMDLGMPVMDGWEAARQIRGREWGKNIVLIALTGWGQEEDRRKTKEAGFDHHLVKPASPATIRELLDVGASQQA
jgi:CheY-like chemotaxis protein